MNTTPPVALVNVARRLEVIEADRKRHNNMLDALARKELGKLSNKEITKEEKEQWLASQPGCDMGIVNAQYDGFEKAMIKELETIVANSIFAPFIHARHGLNFKSFGRLWAVIGDPIHLPDDATRASSPTCSMRSIGQLFQYAGVGDPEDKRRKGHKVRHNPKVGPRLHVIAECSGVKARGRPHYRDVYDEAKSAAKGRLHSMTCNQCGTKSSEAKAKQRELDLVTGGTVRVKNDVAAVIGTPWRPGHINGHGYRMVKRAFLRDLWEEAHALK